MYARNRLCRTILIGHHTSEYEQNVCQEYVLLTKGMPGIGFVDKGMPGISFVDKRYARNRFC